MSDGGFQDSLGARAVTLTLALATATDAVALFVAPHGCAPQWGINAVQFGRVDLPLTVLVLSS